MTSRLVREFFTTRILKTAVQEVGDRISADEAPLRMSLVASQLFGLALTRYLFKFDAVADAPIDVVVSAVAPTLDRYLFGELTQEEREGGGN